MVRVLAMFVGGVLLFLAGLIGTLGARGKLNGETLNQFLGKEAPVSEEHPAPDEEPPKPEKKDAAEREHAKMESPESHIERSVAASPIIIEAPFSDEETRRLFDELRGSRSEVIEARAEVDRDRHDMELVRLDLNRRWDEVELREQKFEELRRSVAAERSEIEQRTVLLKEAEIENLQQLARNVEKMSSDGAAQMLMKKPSDRAALILRFVKPRETGKILDAMTMEFAAEVAEKMLGILDGNSSTQNGGE